MHHALLGSAHSRIVGYILSISHTPTLASAFVSSGGTMLSRLF